MTSKSSPNLLRQLGVMDAGALVVGCIIGAGIFRLSDSVAQNTSSVFMFLLAWILGGFLSLAGALCYAELATRFPKAGGDYVFLSQGYGSLWGFLFGWTKVFVERTGTIAIVAFIFSEHTCRLFGIDGQFWVKPLASAAVLLLTFGNIIGVRVGKNIQNTFTFLKVAGILLIIALGLIMNKGSVQNFEPFWPQATSFWDLVSSTGIALLFVLWTFGGWTEAAYVAEEVKDPLKNLPRSILGGVFMVTGIYLLINTVYLYYLPLPQMAQEDLVATAIMDIIWPGHGGGFMAALVMISTFGALNGYILTSSRILLAMGRDHILFDRLATLNTKTHTPVYALVFNAVVAILLIWTGALDKIVTYTEVVIMIFFATSGFAVFIFRKKEGLPKGVYKVWGYPWMPALFVLLNIALVINGFIRHPWLCLAGLGVAGLGLPLYYLSKKYQPRIKI